MNINSLKLNKSDIGEMNRRSFLQTATGLLASPAASLLAADPKASKLKSYVIPKENEEDKLSNLERINILNYNIEEQPGVKIVKVGASWCTPCNQLDDDFKQNYGSKGPEEMRVLKIDADNDGALIEYLRDKYKLGSDFAGKVPDTIVFNEKGEIMGNGDKATIVRGRNFGKINTLVEQAFE